MKNKAYSILDLTQLLIIVASGVWLIHVCQYGFPSFDEQSYLAVAYRFFQGDNYIVDEWFPAQMWSYIVLPCIRTFMIIHQSTDGIYLMFRYGYVIAMMLVAGTVYYCFSPYTRIGAAIASLLLLWYTPFYITTFSYNTVGIICVALSISLIQIHKKTATVLAGFFFAGAVLADPYLLLVYMFYTLIVIIRWGGTYFTKDVNDDCVISVRDWLYYSFGCVILAVLFGTRLLSTGISRLLTSLPYVIHEQGHQQVSILYAIRQFLLYIISEGGNKSAIAFILLMGLVFVLGVYKESICNAYIIIALIITTGCVALWLCAFMTPDSIYINYLLVPVSAFAPVIMMLTKDSVTKSIFWNSWAVGLGYSLCLHLSSNQNYYAISSAHIICIMSAVIIIFRFLAELNLNKLWIKRLVTACIIILLSINVGAIMYLRSTQHFVKEEGPLENQIEEGPLKGIIVSNEQYAHYEQELNIFKNYIETRNIESVVLHAGNLWGYLYLKDARCAYYSALSSAPMSEYVKERQNAYYKEHDWPELVYVHGDLETYHEMIVHYENEGYKTIMESENTNILLKKQ